MSASRNCRAAHKRASNCLLTLPMIDVNWATSPPSDGVTKETDGPFAPLTGNTESFSTDAYALLPADNCNRYRPGVSAWNVVVGELELPNDVCAPTGELSTLQVIDNALPAGCPAS